MIGQICHHFSWELDYLLDNVDWYMVQRMLIDTPNYSTDKEEKEKEIDLTEQTAEDIEAMLKKYE